MSYNKSLSEIQYQLDRLKSSLADYRLKKYPNAYFIQSQQKLISSIESFILESEQEKIFLTSLVELNTSNQQLSASRTSQDTTVLVQKLALLVATAGIKWPTINQPLPLLYDYYLSSQGRHNEVGEPRKDYTVILPVI